MLDLVGVFLGVGVNPGHALAVRSSRDTGLSGVDIVVKTVQCGHHNHGWKALTESLDVVPLVDLTCTHGVLVESAHGPSNGAAGFSELGMEFPLALLVEFLIGENRSLVFGIAEGQCLGADLLLSAVVTAHDRPRGAGCLGRLFILLDHSVIGNWSLVGIRWGWTVEE